MYILRSNLAHNTFFCTVWLPNLSFKDLMREGGIPTNSLPTRWMGTRHMKINFNQFKIYTWSMYVPYLLFYSDLQTPEERVGNTWRTSRHFTSSVWWNLKTNLEVNWPQRNGQRWESSAIVLRTKNALNITICDLEKDE